MAHDHDHDHDHPHHDHHHHDHDHDVEDGHGHAHAHDHHHAHDVEDGHGHTHAHDHHHAHDDVEHGHDHPHDHNGHDEHGAHGHAHDEGQVSARPDLARGAGRGKILYFDAPSGLAGDMIVAALLDLGVPVAVVEEAVTQLGVGGFHLHVGHRERHSIVGTAFDVHVDAAQPSRNWAQIRTLLEQSSLTAGVKARALAIFERLAKSEAKVHHAPIDDVHFHEVGAVDSIVDVVGAAAALDYLDADLFVSPLPVGRGFVQAAHGRIPLPAPAVLDCLSEHIVVDGGLPFEFVTPTGAAIVGSQGKSAATWPSMRSEHTGWGAGTAKLADRPNLLRAVLGSPATSSRGATTESLVEVHTHVDDVSGEILAYCMEELLRAGARDVWAAPILMKKGRPAHDLGILADPSRVDAMLAILFRETGTLGARVTPVSRLTQRRTFEDVSTPWGPVPFKVAGDGTAGGKPELNRCAALARAHNVPLREVLHAAQAAWHQARQGA